VGPSPLLMHTHHHCENPVQFGTPVQRMKVVSVSLQYLPQN